MKKQVSTQLNAGENTEELYRDDSANMYYLKINNDKIEFIFSFMKAVQQRSEIVGLKHTQ